MKEERTFLHVSILLTSLIACVCRLGVSAQAQCKAVAVATGDYCDKIATNNQITVALLQSYNPALNCDNLDVGMRLCVSNGTLPLPPLPPANSNGECVLTEVRSGEWCDLIATRCEIPLESLQAANPDMDCNLLAIGQKLCCSAGTKPSRRPKPNPDGTCFWYTVSSGDNCGAIAAQNDITVAEIESFNPNTFKFRGCNYLQVGYGICLSSGNPPPVPPRDDAECGPESVGNKECPLKACCSPYGYCGVTSDFCEPTESGEPCLSNCFQPNITTSCNGSQLKRKVGYYASWGADRKCNPVNPNQLDLKFFTHVIFSFAVINENFTIGVSAREKTLLRQLVARKSQYPGLKVMIAVGGFGFSQDDATKHLFPNMIGKPQSRRTFISSVIQFLRANNLDGIDIDFEYPTQEDTTNLSIFMQELRKSLPKRYTTSIATPASYYFLQDFDIGTIAKSVDFINMMTYDYHGPWDTQFDSKAYPQTSMLDILDTVKLYLRPRIPMAKFNLGIAWYGRSYQLADKNCTGYGCAMLGGGTAGRCTEESGYVASFEIEEIIAQGAVPNFDSETGTMWTKHNGDLITYDNQKTWKLKHDFAKKSCFGGTMIWSMDLIYPFSSIPSETGNRVSPTKTIS